MKQVIVEGHLVTKINENAEEPITVGIAVPDDLVVSVGQILEDDLTVRDITNQEIIDRYSLKSNFNKSMLYLSLTEEELASFISVAKTTASIEIVKEILDAGGLIDLNTNTSLVDENIITAQRKEDIIGITKAKQLIANGIDPNLNQTETVTIEEEETTTATEAPATEAPATEAPAEQ